MRKLAKTAEFSSHGCREFKNRHLLNSFITLFRLQQQFATVINETERLCSAVRPTGRVIMAVSV